MVRTWGRTERVAAWLVFLGITGFGFWRVQTLENHYHTENAQRAYVSCEASNQVRAEVLKLALNGEGAPPPSPDLQAKDPYLYQAIIAAQQSSKPFYSQARKLLAPLDCYVVAGIKPPPPKGPIPTDSPTSSTSSTTSP